MASAGTAVGAPTKEIKFIAVARRGDKAVLCHRIHTSDKSYDYIANVQKASGRRRPAAGRERLSERASETGARRPPTAEQQRAGREAR